MSTLLDRSFFYSVMVILVHIAIKIVKKKKSDCKTIPKKGPEAESKHQSLQRMETVT